MLRSESDGLRRLRLLRPSDRFSLAGCQRGRGEQVTNLCRALNDLLLARRRLNKGYAVDSPAIEHFYDIRAVATHSWELAKFLSESERGSDLVSAFVDSLPSDVVENHRHAIAVLYGDDDAGATFRRELASARDQATHYSRLDHKLLRSALRRMEALEAEILLGKRWGDFRANFAAGIDAQMFFPIDDDTAPFERFSTRLNELSGRLVRFSRVAIDHYFLQYKGHLTVVRGPDAGDSDVPS